MTLSSTPMPENVPGVALDVGYEGVQFMAAIESTWKTASLGDEYPAADVQRQRDAFNSSLDRLEECISGWHAVKVRELSTALSKQIESMWQGPEHRRRIDLRSKVRVKYRHCAFADDYLVLEKLDDLGTALLRLEFGRMAEVMVGLGAAVAAVNWASPAINGDSEMLTQSVRPFIDAVPTLIDRLQINLPSLHHLDLDFSEREFYRDPRSGEQTYPLWLGTKLAQVLPDITWAVYEYDRRGEKDVPTPTAYWITASEAIEVAQALDYKLSLSQVTKLCNERPPPFQSRIPIPKRREIHLPSFVHFVLVERRGQTAPDEELAYKREMAERIALAAEARKERRDLN